MLACPACRTLVHAAELRRLANSAKQAAAAGELQIALQRWRAALDLLPPAAKQHAAVLREIDALSRAVDAGGLRSPPPLPTSIAPTSTAPPSTIPLADRAAYAAAGPPGLPPIPGRAADADAATGSVAAAAPARHGAAKKSKRGGVIGGVVTGAVLLLWKLKAVAVILLTKGKLLLLGFTKAPTALTMLASFWVYWQFFGWQFAAGLVISIYIHEMGHVIALQRYGIPATAPMFIPGLGALIRLKSYPHSDREAARTGLAGPVAGLGAAAAAYALYLGTRAPIWGAIAQFGGAINLFNLLPVFSLDGAHGFRAMTRWQRWLCVGALVGMGYLTREGLCFLIAIVAGIRAAGARPTQEEDRWAVTTYVALVILLSLLMEVHVPIGPNGAA